MTMTNNTMKKGVEKQPMSYVLRDFMGFKPRERTVRDVLTIKTGEACYELPSIFSNDDCKLFRGNRWYFNASYRHRNRCTKNEKNSLLKVFSFPAVQADYNEHKVACKHEIQNYKDIMRHFPQLFKQFVFPKFLDGGMKCIIPGDNRKLPFVVTVDYTTLEAFNPASMDHAIKLEAALERLHNLGITMGGVQGINAATLRINKYGHIMFTDLSHAHYHHYYKVSTTEANSEAFFQAVDDDFNAIFPPPA
ncbi:hypothetical protein TRVA0_036S00364 [Trichomonascus vanleenenianus]|uniref:uncharacterized protein n=1 Tax=Trichomonascus vanleenenianus TaxID=2268995 RepID=UPI003ECA4209